MNHFHYGVNAADMERIQSRRESQREETESIFRDIRKKVLTKYVLTKELLLQLLKGEEDAVRSTLQSLNNVDIQDIRIRSAEIKKYITEKIREGHNSSERSDELFTYLTALGALNKLVRDPSKPRTLAPHRPHTETLREGTIPRPYSVKIL